MSETAVRSVFSKRLFLSVGAVILFLILFLHPEASAAVITDSMRNFCRQLVPVLFPYMVLSHFFCVYGLLDPIAPLFPIGRLFGMGDCAFSVFAMGHLCGYPIGAKMTGELVKAKRITSGQGTVLCAVSSGASPAFLIHIVGGALWNDTIFGTGLFLLQAGIGLLAGTLLGRRLPECGTVRSIRREESVPFSRCFCEAVGGSAVQLVSICGYIVFFSLLASFAPGSTLGKTVAASVLEFSSGTKIASVLGGVQGAFLTGFAAGFGGLSVFSQITHILVGSGVSARLCFAYKLILGGICGFYGILYFILHPAMQLSRNAAAAVSSPVSGEYLMLFFCLMTVLLRFCCRKRC